MQVILKWLRDVDRRLQSVKFCNFKAMLSTLWVALSFCPLPADAEAIRGADHTIEINQIAEFQMPANAAIVLIGNPDIADILSQNASSIVIVGKRIGHTNLLVRDSNQQTLLEIGIRISEAESRHISIFHGTAKTDYSCGRECQSAKSEQTADSNFANAPKVTGSKP